jgi:hypothetical protein
MSQRVIRDFASRPRLSLDVRLPPIATEALLCSEMTRRANTGLPKKSRRKVIASRSRGIDPFLGPKMLTLLTVCCQQHSDTVPPELIREIKL